MATLIELNSSRSLTQCFEAAVRMIDRFDHDAYIALNGDDQKDLVKAFANNMMEHISCDVEKYQHRFASCIEDCLTNGLRDLYNPYKEMPTEYEVAAHMTSVKMLTQNSLVNTAYNLGIGYKL